MYKQNNNTNNLTEEELILKENIYRELAISGQREILKSYFRTKLTHSGWKENVQGFCREQINDIGLKNVTVDQMFTSVEQPARDLVPNEIKAEMVDQVIKFAYSCAKKSMENNNLNNNNNNPNNPNNNINNNLNNNVNHERKNM
eukprot:TRINITY_DN11365_c0_g1_i1.p1 TRINITY_DN11365_c0_g1~~TRINITY_DN11365_c0_g1_i1.p1  ORF type:complete len:144 (-),score=33.24 TRINITY_DN11365_c0_g1_i1:59-490(-)